MCLSRNECKLVTVHCTVYSVQSTACYVLCALYAGDMEGKGGIGREVENEGETGQCVHCVLFTNRTTAIVLAICYIRLEALHQQHVAIISPLLMLLDRE